MTDRFPLIVDPSTQRVKELASGDKLDLTGSGVVADVFTVDTNSEERLRIDTSGFLGIGESSPSSYDSGARNLVVGSTSNTGILIKAGTSSYSNLYFGDGTASASYRGFIAYNHNGDTLRFGSSGQEHLRIDSSGRMGLGTTSPTQKLDVRGSVYVGDNIGINTTIPSSRLHVKGGSLTTEHGSPSAGTCQFNINCENNSQVTLSYDDQGHISFGTASAPAAQTGFSEKMRIDSAGRLGVGFSSPSRALSVHATGTDAITGYLKSGVGDVYLQLGNSVNDDGYIGYQSSNMTFYTNNDLKMLIDSSGRVSMPNTGGYTSVTGHTFEDYGLAMHVTQNDTCLLLNRQAADGTLVQFRHAAATEGTIEVNGTTVSLVGGHLSRWSQLPGGAERTEILRGSVLSNIDEMCEWSYEAKPAVLWGEGDGMPEGVSAGDIRIAAQEAGTENNEQLNRMKVSDVEGDKNVSGVFQSWDDDDDTYTNDFYCAMTGDFVIRIAQGTTVARGDLLMSAGDGTAKPQDDDIVRSKTIAKVTSTTVSATYSDGSYCVPCVLMAC
jgi:hypothetical protein